MAKYMDYLGVKYFWQKILARFSKKGHTHTVSLPAGTSTTVVTSVTNSVPPTLGTAISAQDASLASSSCTLTFTARSIPNVTSAGSASSYGTGTVYSAVSGSATTGADIDPS